MAEEIDLTGMLWRHWLMLLVAAVAGLAAGVAATLLLPKKYQASVVLAPASTQAAPSGLGSVIAQFASLPGRGAAVGLSGEPTTDEFLAIAVSRSFLEPFVTDNDLIPVLYPESSAMPVDQQATIADACRRLRDEIISVSSDVDTGLVTLGVTWTDPELAASWANQLTERLNEVARTRAIDEAERGLRYLREELGGTGEVQIRDAINALVETQLQKILLARVRTEYAFRVVDPAVAPDPDDYSSPRPVLVVAFAVIAAVCFTFIWLLFRERRRLSGQPAATG